MTTAKQSESNRLNALHSTGPKTEAGKAISAANALKHGLSAEKYLMPSESSKEFDELYAASRKCYPPDLIIDRLVWSITIAADFRSLRALEAEAQTLKKYPLEALLLDDSNGVKNLSTYEASNRKTLKMLEEQLERRDAMVRKMTEVESRSTVGAHDRREEELAAPDPATNSEARPPQAATPPADQIEADRIQTAKPNLAREYDSPIGAPAESGATRIKERLDLNQKTNPVSINSGVAPVTEATAEGRVTPRFRIRHRAPGLSNTNSTATAAAVFPSTEPPRSDQL